MAGDKLDCETTSKLKSIYARKVKMPFVCSGRFQFSTTYEKLERAAFASVEKCMAKVTTTTTITTKKAHTRRRINTNNSTCSNRYNEYSYFVYSCRRTRASTHFTHESRDYESMFICAVRLLPSHTSCVHKQFQPDAFFARNIIALNDFRA